MKVVIIGAGFTGLTAAYRLLQAGHTVSVLEKESRLGGLATGYTHRGWKWHLDRAYHHLFTNDVAAISLAQEIGQKLTTITPKTCVLTHGRIIPFDSPASLLSFPYLSWVNKLRTGVVLGYLKLARDYKKMESIRAVEWIQKYMGVASYQAIWEPLFRGKFHGQAEQVMLPWFWARIKKRTQSLAYPVGGFTAFLEQLAKKIVQLHGSIQLETPVQKVLSRTSGGYQVVTAHGRIRADAVLYTGPTIGFPYLFGQALQPVRKPHHYLTAQILVLRLRKAFLPKTYWLNMTDPDSPFLVLVDHTNFVSPKYYHGEHLVYLGNYLPPNHPYLQMSKTQLLKLFSPYLEQIKPAYRRDLIGTDLFTLPYAQAVVNTNYIKNMSHQETGLPGVYIANIDSVYPWDRGTNYAIEKGDEVAALIMKSASARA